MMLQGEVVYLYAFDVANEIVTAKVEAILSSKPVPFEIKVEHTYPKDVPLYRPLAIEPPSSAVLLGRPVRLLIRVYEVGVVTVALRIHVTCADLLELMPFHNARLDDGRSLDEAAHSLCEEVCHSLQEFMIRSSPPTDPEAYTVFCLTDLGGEQDAARWLAGHQRIVAGLLAETPPDRLSESQVADTVRLRQSFETTDLAVIDWDAALVVDLSGYVDDVLYMLELANLQLEEFRWMDQALDRYLDRAYDDVGRRRFPLFGRSAAVLRELRRFRVDVNKLADEVTHITKFLGDWYLARVYLAARERFHLDQWRSSVERRLAQIDQIYSVFHGETNDRRMLWLEAIIVILFIIDLLAIFLWKH